MYATAESKRDWRTPDVMPSSVMSSAFTASQPVPSSVPISVNRSDSSSSSSDSPSILGARGFGLVVSEVSSSSSDLMSSSVSSLPVTDFVSVADSVAVELGVADATK